MICDVFQMCPAKGALLEETRCLSRHHKRICRECSCRTHSRVFEDFKEGKSRRRRIHSLFSETLWKRITLHFRRIILFSHQLPKKGQVGPSSSGFKFLDVSLTVEVREACWSWQRVQAASFCYSWCDGRTSHSR